VSSKVGFAYPGTPHGLSPNIIVSECEKSLRRLKTDRIDLYYAHGDDPSTPMESYLRAFDQLVQQGKVRLVGASNYTSRRLASALDLASSAGMAQFCCLQQRMSLIPPRRAAVLDFTQQFAWNDVLELCRDRELTLLGYSALLNGYYCSSYGRLPWQYDAQHSHATATAVNAIAGELGVPPVQVVLAYLFQLNPSVLPVLGVSTESQLLEDVGADAVQLSAEQIKTLADCSSNDSPLSEELHDNAYTA
jgi:aryl-alcohol dehydrogenase-like predicted oxidoreductase